MVGLILLASIFASSIPPDEPYIFLDYNKETIKKPVITVVYCYELLPDTQYKCDLGFIQTYKF